MKPDEIKTNLTNYHVNQTTTAELPVKLFSFALYKICSGVELAEDSDRLFSMRVGAIQLSGLNATNILICGNIRDAVSCDAMKWQSPTVEAESAIMISLKFSKSLHAMSLINQHVKTDTSSVEIPFSTIKTFASKDPKGSVAHTFYYPTKSHVVMEIKLSSIELMWDEASVIKSKQIIEDLYVRDQWKSFYLYSAEKFRLALLSKYRSLRVLNEPDRLSIFATLKVLKVLIPVVDNVVRRKAVTSRVKRSNFESGKKSRESKLKYFRLAMEVINFNSGDYLDSLLNKYSQKLEQSDSEGAGLNNQRMQFSPKVFRTHQNSTVTEESNSTRSLPSCSANKNDQAIRSLADVLAVVRNPIVQSFAFIANKILFDYITIDHITKMEQQGSIILNPWRLCGALSLSSVYSHPDFTDNRVDVFCGPLKIDLDTQVNNHCLALHN